MAVIGIDLGTTFCCAAVLARGTPESIINDLGNRTTPSYVAFTENDLLIGGPARDQTTSNPANTVYSVKRLIGRAFKDPSVTEDRKLWSFNVIERDGKPVIKVVDRGTEKEFRPEEISAFLLKKMKQISSDKLGEEVKKAVITVPAYFNNDQRDATKKAGEIAGLEVVHILNEPTAAAIAFAYKKDCSKERCVMVFDLGGGTFDVTVMKIKERTYQVVSLGGDSHLGGEDFVNNMMNYFFDEYKHKYAVDLRDDATAIQRMRSACEGLKHTLSAIPRGKVGVILKGKPYPLEMSRAMFENINNQLFQRTIEVVDQTMKAKNIQKSDIDDVLLVGGSSRIPRVRQLLKEYFGGKELNKSINPDEAVAQGAAIRACMSNVDETRLNVTQELILLEVLPLSLGIESEGHRMNILIPRNTTVPCTVKKYVAPAKDFQESVQVRVYQGESDNTDENYFLDEFEVIGIPPMKRGEAKIEITYSVDANVILTVTAVLVCKNKRFEKRIETKNRISPEQLQKMLERSMEYDELIGAQ
ncbi:unnamed protein product [Calicophoron daubneyi]|uniref:Heat shock protein 70 n=1 Tax=Calicophoron daubneyi TaxID=300641 RepID=A0AAV2T951_CALDB